MNSETKICQNCKQSFVIEPEDFDFYKKINVPPPTWCPECRTKRRFMWRNEWHLFRRPDFLDGKEIFSNFPKESYIRVYNKEYWWSDAWDSMQYGRDYDFSRPFFEQLKELFATVPWPSRATIGDIINSDYTMNVGWLKNCYLVFNMDYAEDSLYVNSGSHIKNCVDCHIIRGSELCYESVNIANCYKAFFSLDCIDCHDIYFCGGCIGCNNCFGCYGLRNKSYCIFNRPYSKEEYIRKIKEFELDSAAFLGSQKQKIFDHWNLFPVKYTKSRKNVNCTGEYIQNSKNVYNSYRVVEGEDLKNCQIILLGPAKDSYDQTLWGSGSERAYEVGQCGAGAYNIHFCWGVYGDVKDVEYSAYCTGSSNLFGCMGLKKKEYCVFNKQYSKQEYEKLVAEIKRHMDTLPFLKGGRSYHYGEFFPPELSPFAYNETIAQEYFPLTKAEALAGGYRWRDPDTRSYTITKKPENLPDNIKDVDDSILKDTIGCAHEGTRNEQCTTAFRIIPEELQFYKRMNLPLPRLCPNCRHYQRLKQRNPLKLWHRKCTCEGRSAKSKSPASPSQVEAGQIVYQNTAEHFHGANRCPNEFETSYAPERPEIVYCESCYNSEVV